MYPILHKLYYAYQYTINDTIKLHNYYYHEAYALHQIRRYPAPYISKAGQKATPSNITTAIYTTLFSLAITLYQQPAFHFFPTLLLFLSYSVSYLSNPRSTHTSILTRIVFPADQQPLLNDQFYVEEMPEEIVIVVKLIYSDRTHST